MTAVEVDRALSLLSEGRMNVLGRLPNASNSTLLVEVSADGLDALAVYKPVSGETPLWDFPDGTLAAREVAAHRLSVALGWPNVPPTVLRDGPAGPGSVQLFVDHDPERHYLALAGDMAEAFLPVAAFDVIANNADRKAGHCLLDDDGVVWCVDHGVCFHAEDKLRTVIWEFAGARVPDPLADDVARVAADAARGALRGELEALLSPVEVDAVAARAERLASRRTFPRPGPGRPFPWPPV